MRPRVATALLLLLLPAASLRAQAFRSLFERLGDTIDAYEREYFGFFPGLEGFSSATLLLEGDSLRFVVHRSAGAADSSVALSRREAVLLERFVDAYEFIMQNYPVAEDDNPDDPDRQELELRFGPLLQCGILRFHGANPNRAPPVELRLRNGETSSGTMLFFTDSLLALRTGDIPYYWRSADSGVVFHPYRDVESIARYGAGSFHRGAGTGLLIGTGFMTLLWYFAAAPPGGIPERRVVGPVDALFLASITGGLPGIFIGGFIGMIPNWRVAWKGSELPAVWLRNAALADSVFVFTRRLPPEWRSRFEHAARTTTLPAAAAERAEPKPSRAAAATGRIASSVRLIGFADCALHFYGAEAFRTGAGVGAGLALEFPLLNGRDSMPLLALRPRIGAGYQYGMADVSLLSPRLGRFRLHAGITLEAIRQDIGTKCWTLETTIRQHGMMDHLFAGGGADIESGNFIFELQVRSSLSRIVVTDDDSWDHWCTPPPPAGLTSIQLSWGWKW